VQTSEHISPIVGLQWSSTEIPPLHVPDEANKEANSLLALALRENTMLADRLQNGCLTFCAEDWNSMRMQQGLFVPVNSRVYQRGLSVHGVVKLGSKYFRPVAPVNMQDLLKCDYFEHMILYLCGLHSDEPIDTSEQGMMYMSLKFFESMLDQIMNVQRRTGGSKDYRYLIQFVECILIKIQPKPNSAVSCTTDTTWSSTALCEITCYVLYQISNKLGIRVHKQAPSESPAVYNGEYMETHSPSEYSLYLISNTHIDDCLFNVLKSNPQQTERQCLTTFYVSSILINIAQTNVTKYHIDIHKQSVHSAFDITRQNILEQKGFMVVEILNILAVLQERCE